MEQWCDGFSYIMVRWQHQDSVVSGLRVVMVLPWYEHVLQRWCDGQSYIDEMVVHCIRFVLIVVLQWWWCVLQQNCDGDNYNGEVVAIGLCCKWCNCGGGLCCSNIVMETTIMVKQQHQVCVVSDVTVVVVCLVAILRQ